MSAQLIEQLVLVTHLLLSLAIIGLIIIQQGKGADAGASFGAGASQTVFGSTGSGNVLTRATAWMVTLFFITSFGLAVIAKNKTAAVDEFAIPLPTNSAPATLDSDMQAVDDMRPAEGDLPVVDDSMPSMSADGMDDTVDSAQEDIPQT
ncbi:preprotein translocase subunit SecG [Congregibacter litoralis]|uniref:Protein-export membrane protein SecG n=1 Tax=Congregibacter litoralis KT71 TaxID=314285 RepID=A4A9Y7_9GAMM|nr:protein translocase subunit secG [Congregibacter litoralis KT71]